MKTFLIVILVIIIGIAGITLWKHKTPSSVVPPASEKSLTLHTPPATVTENPPLDRNGIGTTMFGTAADTAIATFTTLFGTPTKDTGWIDSFSSYGTCPGKTIRVVEWNRLRAFFGDTSFGTKSFFHYEYTDRDTTIPSPALSTSVGLTLGSNMTQLKTLYPQVVITGYEESLWSGFVITSDKKTNSSFGGTYDGKKVFWIEAGIPCGE